MGKKHAIKRGRYAPFFYADDAKINLATGVPNCEMVKNFDA